MTTRFLTVFIFLLCSATLFATGDDIELYSPYMDSLSEKYSVRLDLTNRTLGLSGLTNQSTAHLWQMENYASMFADQSMRFENNKLIVNSLKKDTVFGNWQEISLQFTSWVGQTNIPMGGDHTDTMVGMYVDLTGNAQLTATFETNVDCDVMFYLVDANGHVGNCKYPEQTIKAGRAQKQTFTFEEDSLLDWYSGNHWGISNGRHFQTQMSYGDIWESIPVVLPEAANIPVDISKIVKIIMIVNSGVKGTLNEEVTLSISDMILGNPAKAVVFKPFSTGTNTVRYIRSNVRKVPYPSRFTVHGGVLPTLNVSEYRSNVVACGEYLFANKTHRQSGEYIESYKTASGEDSIAIINLIINPIFSVSVNKYINYGSIFMFGSQPLSQSGNYSHTFMSRSGCDSTVNLSLTVLPMGYSYYDIYSSSCGKYEFNGASIFESGTYIDTIQLGGGSFIIDALHLTVNSEYSIERTATIANGEQYLFGTFNLTAPGTYYQQFKSVHGCDSSIKLTLIDETVNQPIIHLDRQMLQGTIVASPFSKPLGTSQVRYSLIQPEGFAIDPIFGTISVLDPTNFATSVDNSSVLTIRVSEGNTWYDVILPYTINDVSESEETFWGNKLMIYPNEFSTFLNISASSINGTITITSIKGVEVYRKVFCDSISVNTELWTPGVYVATVTASSKQVSSLIVKK